MKHRIVEINPNPLHVCVCVHACVRACVRAHACVNMHFLELVTKSSVPHEM